MNAANPGQFFDLNGGLAGITGPNRLVATIGNGQQVVEIDPATGQVTLSFVTSGGYAGVAVSDGQILLGTRASAGSTSTPAPAPRWRPGRCRTRSGAGRGRRLPGEDWYAIDLAAGAGVRLHTTTPAGGPGEFVNNLNPRIELYDPSGNLVASGVTQLDGRNEVLTFAGGAAGTYRVRLTAQDGTAGEYFLGIDRAPVAGDDAATTDEDTPVDIDVLGNDADDLGLVLGTVTITRRPGARHRERVRGRRRDVHPGRELLWPGHVPLHRGGRQRAGVERGRGDGHGERRGRHPGPDRRRDRGRGRGRGHPARHRRRTRPTPTGRSRSRSRSAGCRRAATLSAGTDTGGGVWTLTPAQLAGLTLTVPDNLPGDAPFTLTVTATATETANGSTASATATIDVTVRNVAPQNVAVTGPAAAVRGQTLSYTGTFTDPGTADTHTRAWTVTRERRDRATGTGAAFSFAPTEAGTYEVTFTVTDDDGAPRPRR